MGSQVLDSDYLRGYPESYSSTNGAYEQHKQSPMGFLDSELPLTIIINIFGLPFIGFTKCYATKFSTCFKYLLQTDWFDV